MTLKAFIFLLVVTIVAVTGSALIAEMLLAPGFERGIVIAVLSGLVVFPAARWAEYRGWIEGAWSPGGEARRQRDARRSADAAEAVPLDAKQREKEAPADSSGARTRETQQPPAGQAHSLIKAGETEHPGDSR